MNWKNGKSRGTQEKTGLLINKVGGGQVVEVCRWDTHYAPASGEVTEHTGSTSCGMHVILEIWRARLSQEAHCVIYSLLFVVVQAPSCVWLCDPMDYRLSGSSVHGVSQARILEWVAISFRGSSIMHINEILKYIFMHSLNYLYFGNLKWQTKTFWLQCEVHSWKSSRSKKKK